jgi:enamine deaminase RidA (YjgF/YER057c/UK114 family)
VMADGGDPPPDALGQARRCLEIIATALAEAGASVDDVVRTRVYLVRVEDFEQVGRAHGEVFADTRPANTTLLAGGLLDPRWLVEIEAEAIVSGR